MGEAIALALGGLLLGALFFLLGIIGYLLFPVIRVGGPARSRWYVASTGSGSPYLVENGIPYPTRVDEDNLYSIDLDGEWELSVDGGPWEPTSVPGNWNLPGSAHTAAFGRARYRRTFRVDAWEFWGGPDALAASARAGAATAEADAAPGDPSAPWFRLVLEGVLLRSRVWLNGTYLGGREGGYTPVVLDASAALQPGLNELLVESDNRLTATSLPPSIMRGHAPGWYPYGGIHRSVRLERVPQRSICAVRLRATPQPAAGGRLSGSVLVHSARERRGGPAGAPPPSAAPPRNVAVSLHGPDGALLARTTAEMAAEADAPGTAAPGTAAPGTAAARQSASRRGHRRDTELNRDRPAVTEYRFSIELSQVSRYTPADPALYYVELRLPPQTPAGPADTAGGPEAAAAGVTGPAAYAASTATGSAASAGPADTAGHAVTVRTGFRSVGTRGRQLILNGEALFLRGIAKHEDHPDSGSVVRAADVARDLDLIRDLGANYIRLAHYPHDPKLLDAARDRGLLLSQEIPLYQAGTGFLAWLEEQRPIQEFPLRRFGLRQLADPLLRANAHRELMEMIERDRNNPAILFWSLGNECYSLFRRSARRFAELRRTARRFDPTRPTTVAEATYNIPALDRFRAAARRVDIASINMYYGWYYGSPRLPLWRRRARRQLTRFSAIVGRRPVIISECGADAAPGRSEADGIWRAERVRGKRSYSEEYQAELLAAYVRLARAHPSVTGISPWIFADFACPWFPSNPIPGYNLKGILSADRHPKEAYRAVRELYEGRSP
jgi:hypothetical protein